MSTEDREDIHQMALEALEALYRYLETGDNRDSLTLENRLSTIRDWTAPPARQQAA